MRDGETDPVVAEAARERLREIVAELPEVDERDGHHSAFAIRGKNFLYFTNNHHGDGRIALNCKAAPGVMGTLVDENPERYFVPAYLGKNGWVGMRLEPDRVDWEEAAAIVRDGWRAAAPKSLLKQLGLTCR